MALYQLIESPRDALKLVSPHASPDDVAQVDAALLQPELEKVSRKFLEESIRTMLTIMESQRRMHINASDVEAGLNALATGSTPFGTEPVTYNMRFPAPSHAPVLKFKRFKLAVREVCQDFRCDPRWTKGATTALLDATECYLALVIPSTWDARTEEDMIEAEDNINFPPITLFGEIDECLSDDNKSDDEDSNYEPGDEGLYEGSDDEDIDDQHPDIDDSVNEDPDEEQPDREGSDDDDFPFGGEQLDDEGSDNEDPDNGDTGSN